MMWLAKATYSLRACRPNPGKHGRWQRETFLPKSLLLASCRSAQLGEEGKNLILPFPFQMQIGRRKYQWQHRSSFLLSLFPPKAGLYFFPLVFCVVHRKDETHKPDVFSFPLILVLRAWLHDHDDILWLLPIGRCRLACIWQTAT